jgi:hypothetical protein
MPSDTLGPHLWLLLYLLLLHLLADLAFLQKIVSFDDLVFHAFLYGLILWAGMSVLQRWPIDEICRFTIVNFGLHLLLDYITLTVSAWGISVKKDANIFIRMFTLDQVLHIACLIVSCEYLLLRW